ncbi:hypothetical protein O181_056161 [Austropuccinia psidii MF-1]|uniref:Uncharacterized protein n=1 Tax=Austropuccinia psidii MF-1 TaxID=1389203 RepID=A0A9Q3HSP1_9BASI|nr:hypothetical protein [Austropuccinia psidii MF-1]
MVAILEKRDYWIWPHLGQMSKRKQNNRRKFGLVIHIQQPKLPLEVVHIDWVPALPSIGRISYDYILVMVDRIFLLLHEDGISMDVDILSCNNVISHTSLFKNIISERDSKYKSEIWTDCHRFFGTKLSFSKEYPHQTDGIKEKMT